MSADGMFLIGYRSLVEEGFALPVYGSAPVPNQIHLAVTVIEGDHLSLVDRFEEAEPFEYVPLPAPYRRVHQGSRWIDVFVWRGVAFVGEPTEVFEHLRPEFDVILREEPLVGVDLLLAADTEVGDAFERASEWVRSRYGQAMTNRWSVGILGTQIVRLQLRRAYAAAGLTDVSDILRVRLHGDADRVVLHSPESVDERMSELWGPGWAQQAYARSPHRTIRLDRRMDADPHVSPVIRSVEVRGQRHFDPGRVIVASALRPGLRLTPELADDACRAVMRMGFYDHASIECHVSGVAVIAVAERPVLRSISIMGPGRLSTQALRSQIESIEGGPFDKLRADRDAERLADHHLRQTGYHAEVELEAVRDDGEVALTFHLRETSDVAVSDESVLVVVSGSRANAIASHIKTRRPRRGRAGSARGRSPLEIVVVSGDRLSGDDMAASGPFTAIAWLADDKAIQAASTKDLQALADWGHPMRPLLIAPALPEDRPSTVLTRTKDLKSVFDSDVAVLIDTSLARSPLPRWGRRSLDRRIADMVVAALELIRDPFIESQVAEAIGRKARMLSWAPGQGSSPPFASEAMGDDVESALETGERFITRDTSPNGTSPGMGALHTPVHDFVSFAGAVMRSVDGRYAAARIEGTNEDALAGLAFPGLTAVFRREGSDLLVSAELPTPAVIEAAARAGYLIARYTDLWAIRAWTHGHVGHGSTPDEIAMPKLRRFRETRGLVVRGLDTRDVLRLPASELGDLLETYPQSDLRRVSRAFVRSFDFQTFDEAAVPIAFILQADRENDPIGNLLARRLRSQRLPAKRMGDLAATWTPPRRGRRWCLEDGALPVRIRPLNEREAPSDAMFTIDGDGAVPALFLSRVFTIWARATMTRSLSWPSRFAVTRTFETLPIPRQFVLAGDETVKRPSLMLDIASELESVTDELVHLLDSSIQDAERRLAQIMLDIDRQLLSGFDLPVDASDIEVLQRLLRFNQSCLSSKD